MSEFFDNADLDTKAAQDKEEFDSADWTPEAGEELTAVVLERKVVKTKWGMKLVLVIRNVGEKTSGGIEAGKSGNLWCPAVLSRKMLDAQPAQGSGLKVRFEGKVTPEKGGNPYNNHTLLVETNNPQWWAGVREQLEEKGATAPASGQSGSDWKF